MRWPAFSYPLQIMCDREARISNYSAVLHFEIFEIIAANVIKDIILYFEIWSISDFFLPLLVARLFLFFFFFLFSTKLPISAPFLCLASTFFTLETPILLLLKNKNFRMSTIQWCIIVYVCLLIMIKKGWRKMGRNLNVDVKGSGEEFVHCLVKPQYSTTKTSENWKTGLMATLSAKPHPCTGTWSFITGKIGPRGMKLLFAHWVFLIDRRFYCLE